MADNKGIIGKIVDDISESTSEIHEAGKNKFAAQKQSFSERHTVATTPQPSAKVKYHQEKSAFKERHADATTPQPGAKEKFEQEKNAFKERHAEINRKANPKN